MDHIANKQLLSAFNNENKADLLSKLNEAYRDAPNSEPEACRLLRKHFSGEGHFLRHNIEAARATRRNVPLSFAESLFILENEQGQRLNSPDVLHTLQNYRKDLRLASRFRFWNGFDAAHTLFSLSDAFTHISINTAAYEAASPYNAARMERGISILKKSHPDKSVIVEMLEHQPWNDAQRRTMDRLQPLGVGWAVDDYGAPDGHHTTRSLSLAAEYSTTVPPLVKFDGVLLTKSLKTNNFSAFFTRLAEVEKFCPKALLVFEWVKDAKDLSILSKAMLAEGVKIPVSYVQSHGYDHIEQKKTMAAQPRLI